MAGEQNWHTLEVEHVLQTLESGHSGLSEAEAKGRLAQFGRNELQEKKRTSPLVMLLRQFTSFLVLLLIVAAAE